MALQLATCELDLASAGGAPEWVHLFPPGKMTGRDGRAFELADPASVIRDFQSRGVDLPIDYEHQNDRPESNRNGPVPAAGWIKELRSDDKGLWGRVEWTATARELIGEREYRYLSPVFVFDGKTGKILRLKGAGLVHNPNLHLTALASEEPAMNAPETDGTQPTEATDVLRKLAEALSLPPESDPAAILKAVLAALKTEQGASTATARETADPARFVPIEAVSELLTHHNARVATMHEQDARRRVDGALRDGHITPAMRDWATALCMQDAASFDSFLAKSPAPYAHLHRVAINGLPPETAGSVAAATAEEAAICAQLGIKPDRLAK